MENVFPDLMELMKKLAVVETLIDVLLCAVPIWLAVMIGLLIGWSWRPRWTGLVFLGLRGRFRLVWAPPGFGARRLWFAFTALSAFSVCRKLWSSFRAKAPESRDRIAVDSSSGSITRSASVDGDFSSLSEMEREKDVVTEKDLNHLLYLLDDKGGEIIWQNMMERTTSNMTYQAWRHDPEVGPVVYRSRTVFEDATPELVRDFFWDDDFRCKWDPMLTYFKILEECPHNGAMIVHWIKKFPFFCSDREYIIGRRIWESGKTYYCVTKGVPYLSLPKNEKPRRVELYFSSWRIRAVESRKEDGCACEVTLVHYEDMGIPKDVAKMGVRHGMWGAVKKLHAGMRAYQAMKKTGESSLSRSALMAKITTKIAIGSSEPSDSEHCIGGGGEEQEEEEEEVDREIEVHQNGGHGGLDWKWVVVGGVALACGLQSGLIGKALLFGAARRIARR